MKTYTDLLSEEDILYLHNLPEVLEAKNKLNHTSVVYFTITLPITIQNKLLNTLGLPLAKLENVPMRWLQGDTKPHVDIGKTNFDHTYLVYLNDNPGNLLVDDDKYPIKRGVAYVFPESLKHETVNTGTTPRLLLGPMSEQGFAVGGPSPISAPGGSTIYIREAEGSFQYSINDQFNWTVFTAWPYAPETIINTNTSLGLLKVEFVTDLTLTVANEYFICGSIHIQFGSTSLKTDGSRPLILLDNNVNYPGFIKNGAEGVVGSSNIYIYNLKIGTSGDTSLLPDGGWIGQSYFGKGSNNNYVVNCSSLGDIPDGSGGILGIYTGEGEGTVTLKGCSSSGNIGTNAGGIVGALAGSSNGTVTCEGCWSTPTQLCKHMATRPQPGR